MEKRVVMYIYFGVSILPLVSTILYQFLLFFILLSYLHDQYLSLWCGILLFIPVPHHLLFVRKD